MLIISTPKFRVKLLVPALGVAIAFAASDVALVECPVRS